MPFIAKASWAMSMHIGHFSLSDRNGCDVHHHATQTIFTFFGAIFYENHKMTPYYV